MKRQSKRREKVVRRSKKGRPHQWSNVSVGACVFAATLDGAAIYNLVQHWRKFGDVHIHDGWFIVLFSLSVWAILNLVIESGAAKQK